MFPYAIGLDIGITSVGWAVVGLDEYEKPCGIVKMGSRIFEAAQHIENSKYSPPAKPRRDARSMRRRLRRHRHRSERIQHLLVSSGLLSKEALDRLFEGRLEDIYALRVRALDERVTTEELARILIHISQRRGFRSNRKGASSKEDGLLLKAVSDNRTEMAAKGYRTVAELYLKDEKYRDHKRNKGRQYISTVGRDMVTEEVKKIFASQRSLGNEAASEDLEENYLNILLSQRSFDEGPGGESRYARDMSRDRIGHCSLERELQRAAKATYSFEYFTLLEKINHIRLIRQGSGERLTNAQRETLINLAHQSGSLDYSKLRKALALEDDYTFNMVNYASAPDRDAAEKKKKFTFLKAYHQMRKAFETDEKGSFQQLLPSQLDSIGEILTAYKTEAKQRLYLEESGFTARQIEIILSLDAFAGYGHLSLVAIGKLIPFLEQGMNYNDACSAAGYDFRAHDDSPRVRRLHLSQEDLESVTSPVVRRAVSQTVKVVNAIIRDRGECPTFINIELARELAKDYVERQKLQKEMEDNQVRNGRIMERLRTEHGLSDPSGEDLVKLRLYEEQGGICPYSQKPLVISRLFEKGYAEVDHIIPYSVSFDNSYKNKVLVFSEENRNKGNRLPLEYLQGKKRDDFIVWVNASSLHYRKKQKLLKARITSDDEADYMERNLQDTKTMSRFLMNYLNDHLEFAPSERRKKRVTAVNGIITSYMRKRWGITKIRENGDLHHAVDALVVACTTDGMIAQVSHYAKWRECRYMQCETGSLAIDAATGEVLKEFPHPWPQFRKELEARLSSDPAEAIENLQLPFYLEHSIKVAPLFVSHMPLRTVTGAAHKDTAKALAKESIGGLVVRKELTELKLKNGEIADYYAPAKESDALLYEALKNRLIAFDGDGKKAFAEPFRKPKADGSPGPIVKKVKVWEASSTYVPVLNDSAVANQERMVRIDVFHVENDGYYFVPIYVADTWHSTLPNKACVASKPYADWKVMKDENFVFSLYKYDLVRIVHKNKFTLTKANKKSTLDSKVEVQSALLYYSGANISSGAISCQTHDNSYEIGSLGIKTLVAIEKYEVDILGEYHKVTKESRLPFTGKRG